MDKCLVAHPEPHVATASDGGLQHLLQCLWAGQSSLLEACQPFPIHLNQMVQNISQNPHRGPHSPSRIRSHWFETIRCQSHTGAPAHWRTMRTTCVPCAYHVRATCVPGCCPAVTRRQQLPGSCPAVAWACMGMHGRAWAYRRTGVHQKQQQRQQ